MLGSILILAALAIAGVAVGVLLYSRVAGQLPDPGELTRRASAFRSTRIYYNDGKTLLNETFDPNAGRRTVLRLDQISDLLEKATIATEDANFYQHGGVDPVALLRAVWYAVRERELVSGGSTIPQQLVKLVLLTPERSIKRKVKEAILAAEITRRYSKDEILTLYLNEVYYGSFSYGVAAAAETYFGKSANDLTLAEAALLAGLPQAPAYHDPYSHPDRAKRRQAVVLHLMVNNHMISQAEADAALAEPLKYLTPKFDLNAPHFTLYVREQVEKILGPEALYRTGLEVTSTLDQGLQAAAEKIVLDKVGKLGARHVTDGALVAMKPDEGEVVAFVGSADFNNEAIKGQVNMALAPRQPGSALKPFVYLANFEGKDKPLEERWTPGTQIADIRTEFPDGANPPYVPVNYDSQEHGIVTVRTALANSYNVPAVKALQNVGLPTFLELARRVGITTLTRPDYGLSLALGGGEVPLVELTAAYAVLASGGKLVPPVVIREIKNSDGTVLCAAGTAQPCRPDALGVARHEQVVDPVDAFLVTDVLSDNEARTPAFGADSPLHLAFPVAAKTGTTNDYRDNWTMGYTPQLVTGVWVGNADNSAMRSVSGVTGAGPIWHDFMAAAHKGQPDMSFEPPPGVRQVEICAPSGTLPSPACPENERRTHWFAADRPPLGPEHDLYQLVRIDKRTGRRAADNAPADEVDEQLFVVYPPELRLWAIEHGIPQPPDQAPTPEPRLNNVAITEPPDGANVAGVIVVRGSAEVTDFASYALQFAAGHTAGDADFSLPFVGPYGAQVQDDVLGRWDARNLQPGPYTIRLVVRDRAGNATEARTRIFLSNAAPLGTGTATASATATGNAKATFAATPAATASATRPPASPTRPPASPTRPPAATATATRLPPTAVPTAPPTAGFPTAEIPTTTPVPVPPTATPGAVPTATDAGPIPPPSRRARP